MPVQYFLLDSAAAGYADALTALSTLDAAKYAFTPTPTVRFCAHNSELKIVKANISEAELDANPNLVDLRTANFSTELCRNRFTSLAEFRLRGFHVLGESVRGGEATAGRNHYYVRRKTRLATGIGAGPGYGNGDGLTHWDAKDSVSDSSIGSTWQAGHTYTLCGVHLRQRIHVTTPGNNAENMIPFPVGDFTAAPLIWRMDHSLDPGMFCGTLQDDDYDGNGENREWVQDGTNPNVWSRIQGFTGNGSAVFYADPTKSTTGLRTENWLTDSPNNIQDVRDTDWSFWKDTATNTIYVNIPTGENPRFRIGSNGFASGGWPIGDAICDATIRSQGFQFINCQFVYAGGFVAGKFPESQWLGGRYLMNSFFFPQQIAPLTRWDWSIDGEILWDTADRPDADSDPYIARAIVKGSDYGTWKTKMDRFIEIDGGQMGIYEYGTGTAGGLEGTNDITIRGLLGRRLGRYVDSDRNLNFYNADGHICANQGGSGWHMSFLYMEKDIDHETKGSIELYSTTDAANAQNVANCIIEDFVSIRSGLGIIGDGGAYLRTNGTGVYDGNIIRRGCIAEIEFAGDEATFGSPPLPAGAVGIYWHYTADNSPLTVNNVHFYNVGNCLDGQWNSDLALGAGGVTNPARGHLGGNQLVAFNNTYEDFDGRIYYFRELNFHAGLQSVVGLTNANPCVVEITGHGFPDIAQPNIYVEPEVYFDDMVGMTELDGNVYKAVWIDVNHFSLKTVSGVDVDSSAFGVFVSGGCNRAQVGYCDAHDNIIIKSGIDANTDIFRYANGNQSLNEMQALASAQQHLPGSASAVYEVGTTINP